MLTFYTNKSKPMIINTLRRSIEHEEFDYLILLHVLKDYARPRDKITDLLRKGIIVRVKKGLYIFGDQYRNAPYSKELLANLIYGPSYISLEYALSHQGLIPERVDTVTSLSTGRSRRFKTPIGMFTYWSIPLSAYQLGITRIEMEDGRSYLMATPEKAIADKIQHDRGVNMKTQKELYNYLVQDVRIDDENLADLDQDLLFRIGKGFRSRKIRLLVHLVRYLRSMERE